MNLKRKEIKFIKKGFRKYKDLFGDNRGIREALNLFITGKAKQYGIMIYKEDYKQSALGCYNLLDAISASVDSYLDKRIESIMAAYLEGKNVNKEIDSYKVVEDIKELLNADRYFENN